MSDQALIDENTACPAPGRRTKLPVILQDELSECGLACLAMVAAHHGSNITLRYLRQQYSVARDGMSLFQIIKIAEELGFASRPLQLTLEHVKQLRTPAILFWNNMHFVVLESVSASGISIIDPGVGRRFYHWHDAMPLFSHIALELTPGLTLKKIQPDANSSPLSFFAVLSRNPVLLRYLVPMLLLAVLVHVASIAAPKLFSLTIDEVIAKNDHDLLYLLLYIFGALFVFKVLAQWLRVWLNSRLRLAVNLDLSNSVMGWLLRLPLRFFERRSAADILRRTDAVNSAHLQFTAGTLDILVDAAFGLIFLGLMAFINIELAAISLVLCILFIAVRLLVLPYMQRQHKAAIDAEVNRNASFLGTLQAIPQMKLYGYEAVKLANWTNHHAAAETALATVERTNEMNSVLHVAMSHTQSLLISSLGALAVLQGNNSVGDLFAFVLYKDMFLDCTLKVIDKHMQLKLVQVELARTDDIVNHPAEQPTTTHYQSDAREAAEKVTSLKLQQGCFRYSSFEDLTLDNVQLDWGNNGKVAICGTSGAGKTTLLKVLTGFYPLESGIFMVNGIALQRFGLAHYRSRIAFVTADDEIINASVAGNIVFDQEYDGPRLQQVVQQAELLDSILALANGFNTMLGQFGVQLSSGQKQRLLIARALYRQPDIIFFDEPTSHLDADTRGRITQAIVKLPMLCVIVTHDETLLAACDSAYRFDSGTLHTNINSDSDADRLSRGDSDEY